MATTASLHKNKKTTLGRIQRFIAKGPITLSKGASSLSKSNYNIPSFSSQLYSESTEIKSIQHWALPGPHGSWKKYSFEHITSQTFSTINIGDSFGPTWSTHWFKIQLEVPTSWNGKEVHLRWNSNSEATVWNSTGDVLAAFSPDFRYEYIISKCWNGTENLLYYVEMACNGLFGGMEGDKFTISPPDPLLKFNLSLVDIAVFERKVCKLLTDLEMLYGMATELPEEDHRGYQAMHTANEMINLIIKGNKIKANEIAEIFFSEGNGLKAHNLVAMGHCHIDTAWLWPYDETIRKCARSWVSQLQLMKDYPEFVFTCSQAQQFDWVKQFYPALYTEIKTFVSQGRFIPVGGTWVEMDGLIPSGESFIRQFFYGQEFFKKEFGIKCKEFWLPDTFGYSGQIPQILKHVGIYRFLTQKLSWSLVNRFPHHNFWWEGIDGSQVLVHFPPGDSYEMKGTVAELLKSAKNSLDKGRVNVGAYLFGHGDGGGGPTATMLERLNKRVQNVDGLPKVSMQGPDYLFDELLKEKDKMCKWVGELYLELHNGTYTSQGKIKWYNRKSEFLLKEVELLLSIAYVFNKISEEGLRRDMSILDQCWKNVLLNQFHDVLPGSCIELVTEDAWRIYEEVLAELMILRTDYHKLNLGNEKTKNLVLFNPLPWDVKTVVFTKHPNLNIKTQGFQDVVLQKENNYESVEGRYQVPNQFSAVLVDLKASGYSKLKPLSPELNVNTTKPNRDSIIFTNGKISLEINNLDGVPTESMTFKGKSDSALKVYKGQPADISPGMFYIYDDVPLFWDAWDCMDYHLETKQELNYIEKGKSEILAEGPIVGIYKWNATFGNNSAITRYTILRADSPMLEFYVVVDWKESHKFLKVEFPVDILSRDATYEIQFGHLKRPTHINTSWDMAKFEVSGHKWMDISQSDKGVTFITDSKYGWHVRDNVVQLSLLRSPKSPDGNCDMHKHFIHYAVLPHEGTFQGAGVIRKAYELNLLGANYVPLLDSISVDVNNLPNNLVSVTNEAVIVEAVKVAAESIKTICVRVYESFGGSATTRIQLGFPVNKVMECNGLEEPILGNPEFEVEGNNFKIQLTPFQIRSFLVYF